MNTMEIVLLVLLVASVALHVVAKKTKNPYDDAIAEGLDRAREELGKKQAKK
jgi:uncharacterized protein YpmB